MNTAAVRAARQSPLVQHAYRQLITEARAISDSSLRRVTLDALTNPQSCVAYRSGVHERDRRDIVTALVSAGLLTVSDSTAVMASLFPPLVGEGSDCPHSRQPFDVAAGGNGSHHDYPGGLVVHETFNIAAALDLVRVNQAMYLAASGVTLRLDVIRAALIWHDWAKSLIYVWRADGTLAREISIAGTYSHHIVGLAETMARHLPPAVIIAQASAHLGPGRGNDDLIAGWLRAAAILSRQDPIARGYLVQGNDGRFHLPPSDATGTRFDDVAEAGIVNIADENIYSMTATAIADRILATVAPEFGFAPTDVAHYRNDFRNPVLSYLSADRIALVARDRDLAGVRAELSRLADRRVFAATRPVR